jgi:DNA-directed RNA polymerase alpha subunit
MKKKVRDFIGKVSYQGDGLATYIWSKKKDGGRDLIAIVDGYDGIREMFKTDKEQDAFQDAMGEFIAEAINEKIQRETTYSDLLKTLDLREYQPKLSVRLLNCLKQGNINYITDLCNYTRTQLYTMRNFGRKSQIELDDLMDEYGIKFKGE